MLFPFFSFHTFQEREEERKRGREKNDKKRGCVCGKEQKSMMLLEGLHRVCMKNHPSEPSLAINPAPRRKNLVCSSPYR